MMRISASFPLERNRPAGFSMLELLIVLALTSMMVALVAPRLSRTVDAIASSGDRAEVQRQIEDLPLRARQQGQEIAVPAQESLAAVIDLPQGWSATTVTALRIRENGICASSQVRVENGGVTEDWSVAAPDCRVGHAAQ